MRNSQKIMRANAKQTTRDRLEKWKSTQLLKCFGALKPYITWSTQVILATAIPRPLKVLQKATPYKNITVQKKECIDHVQKRMGTHLRNLKRAKKGLGGKGKLTGKLIDELSIYYGLAIRRNCDSIEKMKNAMWATLYHKLSTDNNPLHDKCPIGEDSWCTWQKAKATNSMGHYQHQHAQRSFRSYKASVRRIE